MGGGEGWGGRKVEKKGGGEVCEGVMKEMVLGVEEMMGVGGEREKR